MTKQIGELEAMLRQAGFECRRIRGSHERWIHEALPELPVPIAGKDTYLEKLIRAALQALKDKEEEQ